MKNIQVDQSQQHPSGERVVSLVSQEQGLKPTERPWRLDESKVLVVGADNYSVVEGDYYGRTRQQCEANAELIVHCVNLFPTMVAALQKIYDCGSIKEAERVAASALALATKPDTGASNAG